MMGSDPGEDRYVPIDVLGQGGEATVLLARATGSGGLVVLKRLHGRSDEASTIARFERELFLGRHVSHPNIVSLLHGAVDAHGRFLVFEYVDGVSLQRLIEDARRDRVALPVEVVVRIVLDVLSGLEAAHAAVDEMGRPLGITHRDVSPHNVIVGADGRARLIDFGVADTLADERITPCGTRVGKIAYMAPEYLGDDRADARADVYGVAVTAWVALAGDRPWSLDSDEGIVSQITVQGMPPLASRAKAVPAAIARAVDAGCARDPRHRPATARAFAETLRLAAGSLLTEDAALRMSVLVAARYGDELRNRVTQPPEAPGEETPHHTVVGEAIASHSSRADTDEVTRRDVASPRRPRPLAGKRVVVVDDMLESLELVGDVLERAGAAVTKFGRADTALAHIANARPDLVISDLSMPDCDGYWLVRSLRALGGVFVNTPVIALSALGTQRDVRAALAAGFRAHLAKPADASKLVELAAAALG